MLFRSPEESKGDFTKHELTLYVGIKADTGTHVLSVGFHEIPFISSASLTIVPEHGNMFVQGMVGQYPLRIESNFVNRFPLLLDGEPFANAYLVSVPVFS